jgi:hypothetical protein
MNGMRRCICTLSLFLSHLYEAVNDWHAQVYICTLSFSLIYMRP